MWKTTWASLALLALVGTAQAAPQQVLVSGSTPRLLSDTEFDQVRGRYWMSDGRVLKLRRHGMRVRATLGDDYPVEVRALAPNHLVSMDGRMNLHFSGDENVSNLRLTLERRSTHAGAGRDSVETWTLTSVSSASGDD